MGTVIINYNAGNVASVINALNRLGVDAEVSDDPLVISVADKVIFPGVGHAGTAMDFLKERRLESVIRTLTQPVLGICLGMQLMCKHSEEANTECLGIFDVEVKKFEPCKFKVPQVGWNTIASYNSKLFVKMPAEPAFYFVHSYYADRCDETIAETDYILRYSSALKKNNFYGVQFHPEKSGPAGEQLLKNFLEL